MSILIYGRPNSGRRTLASLLPSAIEQCAYGDPKEVCGVSTFLCATGSLGLAQTAEISNLLRLKCLETVSQQRYIVLIDVERYSAAAIRNLKSLMNVVNAVFILVTSSIAQIDEFVRDRCRHKIHMRFPTPQQLHPLATSIAESLVSGSAVDVVDLALNAAPRTYSELFMATHDAITFVNEKNRIT